MLPFAPACPRTSSVSSARACAGALFDLAKPRLAAMSVLTTLVAYATAQPGRGAAPAALTALGTTLAAAGALALNQWWERAADAAMRRTRGRPLPQQRLAPALALGASLVWSAGGIALLAAVTPAAAVCGAATIVIYGAIYTPLKRRTRWATEIGAVSGALPALLGNAAAGDLAAAPGLALGAILLCWQLPHFFAIGWRHRHDYRAAGFRLLPAIDASGTRTARWAAGYTFATVLVSLVPWALGALGPIYGVTVLSAGLWLGHAAWDFLRAPSDRDRSARRLFLVSIVYLPLVLAALLAESAWGG